MFIQCEHCQTKYQIDEGKLPDRKAVVKCSKCSEDIPLPAKTPDHAAPYQLIECPECNTQYAVPTDRFTKDAIKAHCGKCNHEFIAEKSGATSELTGDTEFEIAGDGLLDQDPAESESYDLGSDELGHLDDLGDVDDLDGGDTLDGAEGLDFDDEPSSEEDDQAYLDSVSLGEGKEAEEEVEMEEITDEDAAGLFLNKNSPKTDEEWPEISDETEPESTDPFLEEEVDLSTQAPSAPKKKEKNQDKKKKSPLLWVCLLLGLAGGGYYYMQQLENQATEQVEVHLETATPTPVKAEAIGNRLTLKEPLRFRSLTTSTGKKVILLKGEIKNLFQPDDIIRKITIKGAIINQKGKVIATSSTYAGILLLDSQITTSKVKELLAHYNDPTLAEKTIFDRFNRQKTTGFQILFTRLPKNGEVFEAKIISYHHNGNLKKVN